ASYISQRNEESGNPMRFRNLFHSIAESWQLNPDFRAYLLYRVADDWNAVAANLSAILRIEAISPIIDYYETFVRLMTWAIVSNSTLALQFFDALNLLRTGVQDERLERLAAANCHMQDLQVSISEASINAMDAFAAGTIGRASACLRSVPRARRDEV